jgi:5-methylcytosine-specific restriction endonuclease McrA
MRRYRIESSAKAEAAVQKARAKKPEKYREYHRQWMEANRPKTRRYGKKWRAVHPVSASGAAARWRATPNGKLYQVRREAMKKAAGELSIETVRRRFRLFGDVCAYCLSSRDIQLEHVLAVARGGTNAAHNIVPACKRCNASKSDRPWRHWFVSQCFFDEGRANLIASRTRKR